jgi:hypothetical protein
MGFNTASMTGITHEVHVRTPDGEIEGFDGVLDVMKLPNGDLKFTHDGNLKQYSDGEVIRSRVNNVNDAHKYVCPDCESDETALITASDYGESLVVSCGNCDNDQPLQRQDL